MTLESVFKSQTLDELKKLFPECVILKNDANYFLGIPDTLILYKDKWAMLEFKRAVDSPHQPNQDYYINIFNKMSYASFLWPDNKEQVINELQQTFKLSRSTRISRRKQISLD